MDQELSQSELEKLIAASAPQPIATEGLKLQILREARRQKHRLQSRYQLVGVVASCLLLFVFTEASLHSVGNASQQLASGFVAKPSPLELCQLELSGAGIGSWAHVDAVMKCRTDIKQLLSPMSSAAPVAATPVGADFF